MIWVNGNVENPVVRDELWQPYRFSNFDEDYYRDDIIDEHYTQVNYKVCTQNPRTEEEELLLIALKDIQEGGHFEGWLKVEDFDDCIEVKGEVDEETAATIEEVFDEEIFEDLTVYGD